MESLSNYQELWDKIKLKLQAKYAESLYNDLFKNSYVYRIAGPKIIVVVSTSFIASRINRNFSTIINELAEELTVEKLEFVFKTKSEYDNEVYEKAEPVKLKVQNNLDSRYTFDNFVTGRSNNVAYKMAIKVAETPGILNPLYLFGSIGLGKTHLIQAIGNYVSEAYPNYKILYVQANNFLKEFVFASQNKTMEQFMDKYNDLDLLLIDDIQAIESAPKTQFEFFNLFNDMYMNHKQIVIASDCAANKLKIMDRLTSRFASGMVVDISIPDLNERLNFLKKKIDETNANLKISQEALNYIANNFSDSIRILDGALTRVINYTQIMSPNQMIDLEQAKEALVGILQSNTNSETRDIDTVLDVISNYYQITRTDLTGPNRNQKYVIPRQICMYILKNTFELTYSKIGKILGHRDHSTVMSGATKIEKEIKMNPELDSAIKTIQLKIEKVDNQ